MKTLAKLLYDINVDITMEPVEGDVKRYRFIFNVLDVDENSSGSEGGVSKKEVAQQQQQQQQLSQQQQQQHRSISSVASDLKMNSSSFCKAFPWHFIMNEKLELVQLGQGFSRLFKSSVMLNGPLATTYFRFKRPKGLSIKFREIARRTNTPFLISLRAPPGKPDFFARVCQKIIYAIKIIIN